MAITSVVDEQAAIVDLLGTMPPELAWALLEEFVPIGARRRLYDACLDWERQHEAPVGRFADGGEPHPHDARNVRAESRRNDDGFLQ